MLKELKSVGGYIRVSTQEQSQKGLSSESQQADIEDYCRRNGYQLTQLYIDRGITARKNLYKRAAFMEMMQDVKEHKINHIVILREEGVVKRVIYGNDFITLESVNTAYPPRKFKGADIQRVQIIGKVKRVMKDL